PTPPEYETPPDDQSPPVDDTKEPQLDEATKAFIEKMVHSAEDKVRTKYTKELNATKKELESFRTASITAQETAEYEKKQLQEQNDEREKGVHQKEMQWAATEALSEV
ncbi:ribonuclease, partial [Bacillus cereus]|nr:ribonuclease [Bacillus cereus]